MQDIHVIQPVKLNSTDRGRLIPVIFLISGRYCVDLPDCSGIDANWHQPFSCRVYIYYLVPDFSAKSSFTHIKDTVILLESLGWTDRCFVQSTVGPTLTVKMPLAKNLNVHCQECFGAAALLEFEEAERVRIVERSESRGLVCRW